MTENGELDNVALSDEQLDKVAELMEIRALAEKQPQYAHLLKDEQVLEMAKAGYETIEDIRAASDEDLVAIKGIGVSAVQTLREWSVQDIGKGNAIARRYLSLKNGDETLDVCPGDVIPAEFGAAEMVEKNKASWQ